MNLIKKYWFATIIGILLVFFGLLVGALILSPKQDLQNRGFVKCTQNLIDELSFCNRKIGCTIVAISENTWCDIKVFVLGFAGWINKNQPTPWSNYIFEPELPISQYVDEAEHKEYIKQNPDTDKEIEKLNILRKELENEQNDQIIDEKLLSEE